MNTDYIITKLILAVLFILTIHLFGELRECKTIIAEQEVVLKALTNTVTALTTPIR